jgi:DNA-binding transcriptional ArsR family regulator
MALEQCYLDWLQTLSEENRNKVLSVLDHTVDTPIDNISNTIDRLASNITAATNRKNSLLLTLAEYALVKTNLPLLGTCSQIDNDLIPLLDSGIADLNKDITALDLSISFLEEQRSSHSNEVAVIETKIAKATSLKF